MSDKTAYWKPHRDDDGIDEIRIFVRERYKTSGLSGDEWRFARVMQFMCKGQVVFERAFNGSLDRVASWVPWMFTDAMESGDMGQRLNDIRDKAGLCMQPGCAEPAVSVYEIIEEFGSQGQRLHPDEASSKWHSHRRRFCQRHLTRGDCGREDSDQNYRVISGPGPKDTNWSGANVTESASVVVNVDSIDQLPNAIDGAIARVRRAN